MFSRTYRSFSKFRSDHRTATGGTTWPARWKISWSAVDLDKLGCRVLSQRSGSLRTTGLGQGVVGLGLLRSDALLDREDDAYSGHDVRAHGDHLTRVQ